MKNAESINNNLEQRECNLHGRCSREAPAFSLSEITLFGLLAIGKPKAKKEITN